MIEINNKVNLDDILDKYGIFQRYHVKMMILIFFTYTTNAVYSAQYIFAAEEVTYRCKDDYNDEYCALNNSTNCTEWIYNDKDSFVAYFYNNTTYFLVPASLSRMEEWKRTLVGTIHGFGYMCGLLVVGPMSDKFGRKMLIIIAGVLGGLFGILRSFSTWYWFYIAMEFLESAIGDNCSPMYVLSLEITASKKRLLFCMLCGLGHTFGGVLLPLIAWLIPNWRWFLRTIYSLAFLFFFYIYILDESPRWLLTKGRKDEAVDILQKAARTNKILVNQSNLEKLSCVLKKHISYSKLLEITFKSKELKKRFLVCLIWWITCTFINYGLMINSVSLQGNKYVNFALTSVVDMPGNMIAAFIMTRFKRKKPLMVSFFATGVLCIAQPFLHSSVPRLSMTIYFIGKLISILSFAITYMYTTELFPTYTRNSMHALCSSLGHLGAMIAPQTPLLIVYWYGLPSLVFGLASIFAGLTTLLVPDVSHDALPDTVDQAESIGRPKTSQADKEIIDSLMIDVQD